VTEKHNHSRYQLELELLQNETSQRSTPQDECLLASSLLEKPSEKPQSHIKAKPLVHILVTYQTVEANIKEEKIS
jgi:hypothetical protein